MPDPDPDLIYECWLADDKNTFAKLKSDEKWPLIHWLVNTLDQADKGDHLHIVVHHKDEYVDGIFGPGGGMICDRCGKELWGGPLDHLTEEERKACAEMRHD